MGIVLAGLTAVVACGGDDDSAAGTTPVGTEEAPSTVAARPVGTEDAPSSVAATAQEADAAPSSVATSPVGTEVPPSSSSAAGAASAPTDADTDVVARFDEIAAAMKSDEIERLPELASGPARAFAERSLHFVAATDASGGVYPNLQSESGAVTVDGDTATLDGTIIYGPSADTARELTDFRFRRDGDQWLLDSYLRAGIPIDEWVAPGSAPVGSGPVTVELVSMFSDLTCATDADSDCPDALRDTISFDLLVENGSDGDLEPGALTLPDGTESPAWLETAGGAHPLMDADVAGFPPGETVPAIALFTGADDLEEGGTLHLVLRTADGTDNELEIPVPRFPHDWTEV